MSEEIKTVYGYTHGGHTYWTTKKQELTVHYLKAELTNIKQIKNDLTECVHAEVERTGSGEFKCLKCESHLVMKLMVK